MGIVFADVATSLDGYVAGPNDGPDNPIGDDGERLHEWLFDLASFREQHGQEGGETGRDSEIVAESFANVGAWIIGRRMFSNEEGPWGPTPFEGHWGDDPPFHAPVFVLTHYPREPLEMDGGTTFYFVTDGVEDALDRAREAAGDADVRIGGGADTIRQFVEAGLLDELEVHLVPVLLGDGIRLFDSLDCGPVELERTRAVESTEVTHLRFRVPN